MFGSCFVCCVSLLLCFIGFLFDCLIVCTVCIVVQDTFGPSPQEDRGRGEGGQRDLPQAALGGPRLIMVMIMMIVIVVIMIVIVVMMIMIMIVVLVAIIVIIMMIIEIMILGPREGLRDLHAGDG